MQNIHDIYLLSEQSEYWTMIVTDYYEEGSLNNFMSKRHSEGLSFEQAIDFTQ